MLIPWRVYIFHNGEVWAGENPTLHKFQATVMGGQELMEWLIKISTERRATSGGVPGDGFGWYLAFFCWGVGLVSTCFFFFSVGGDWEITQKWRHSEKNG